MKSPREILLRRHEAAGPKLDRIRERVLAGERSRSVASRPAGFLSTCQSNFLTLLWPSPWAWGGVAATWLVVAWLNAASLVPAVSGNLVGAPAPEVIRIAISEQRRLWNELMAPEPPPVTPPSSSRPKRQSALSPEPSMT